MLKSNIRDLINQSPYKREYIQKQMNISANTLSNWCTGRSKPSVDDLFKLAKLLNVKVDDLYKEE